MEYIDVQWHHNSDSEPTRLVSELDSRRYETRKLEFFRNGVVGYAARDTHSPGTELGIEPVPSLPEINGSSEFLGITISHALFERLWTTHAASGA